MRYPQPAAIKGSLKWIQILINQHPNVVNEMLAEDIKWVSPLKADEYAEYRDSDFLDLLGLNHLTQQLKEFWPQRGPQWDALGRTDQKVFLVEGKANIPEIGSSCSAKNPHSIAKIKKALKQTQSAFGATDCQGWLQGYYQYANRLAHFYWLRDICNIEAELVFIYFCNDSTHIPTTVTEWKSGLLLQKNTMGISEFKNVLEIFVDCQRLTENNV